jgi:hypothetical protein
LAAPKAKAVERLSARPLPTLLEAYDNVSVTMTRSKLGESSAKEHGGDAFPHLTE